MADNWLANNNPWLIRRPNFRVTVPLYGRVEHVTDDRGNHSAVLRETKDLLGVPWDIPIAGFAASSEAKMCFSKIWIHAQCLPKKNLGQIVFPEFPVS